MSSHYEIEYSELLDFLNQCPIGLIKANAKGEIELMNGIGSQILFPLSIYSGVSLANIKDLLKYFDASIVEMVDSFKAFYGNICDEYRFQAAIGHSAHANSFSITINRISENTYQYTFRDVSALVEKENELKHLIEASAMQAGKLEISTGLLHDIGNAVTAFGTEVVNLKNALEWRELNDLTKLIKMFESNLNSLDLALGQGKGSDLSKFLEAVNKSLTKKNQRLQEGAERLYENTSHIQDVLNIQRQYVEGKAKAVRESLSLQTVIEDALAIQGGSFAKRNIKLEKRISRNTPPIKGDKTHLIQVVINILKNSIEAFDGAVSREDKLIEISLRQDEAKRLLFVEIADNGVGFSQEIGRGLFQKGQTTKQAGTGFGLYNCEQIVSSHHGEISIISEGLNKGARVMMKFPF
ncbi:MAG: signal transduction histidine kinase [Roseivirga sp.]|jgi:signal transduction histidine kinase